MRLVDVSTMEDGLQQPETPDDSVSTMTMTDSVSTITNDS